MTLHNASPITNHDDVEQQIEVALKSSDHQEILKGLEIAKTLYSAALNPMSCKLPNNLNCLANQPTERNYAASVNSYHNWEFVA